MCNRYGYIHPHARLIREFETLGPVDWAGGEPNAPLEEIRPTDRAPIIRRLTGGRLELVDARWGFVPETWTGPLAGWMERLKQQAAEQAQRTGRRAGPNPMTNATCENITRTGYSVAYSARRCLAPATHWFEWSQISGDPKAKKSMFRFTAPAQPVFAFAGVWSRAACGPDGVVESFAILTSRPGPDCAPYHNRQPVVLAPQQWEAWLDPSNDMAGGFAGSTAGDIAATYLSGPPPAAASAQPSLPGLFG